MAVRIGTGEKSINLGSLESHFNQQILEEPKYLFTGLSVVELTKRNRASCRNAGELLYRWHSVITVRLQVIKPPTACIEALCPKDKRVRKNDDSDSKNLPDTFLARAIHWQHTAEAGTVIGIASAIGVIGFFVLLASAGTTYNDIERVALDPTGTDDPTQENVKRFFDSHPRAFRRFINYYFFRFRYARVIGLVRFAEDKGTISSADARYWRNKLVERFRERPSAFKNYLRACQRLSTYRQAHVVIDFVEENGYKSAEEAQDLRLQMDASRFWYRHSRTRLGDWSQRFLWLNPAGGNAVVPGFNQQERHEVRPTTIVEGPMSHTEGDSMEQVVDVSGSGTAGSSGLAALEGAGGSGVSSIEHVITGSAGGEPVGGGSSSNVGSTKGDKAGESTPAHTIPTTSAVHETFHIRRQHPQGRERVVELATIREEAGQHPSGGGETDGRDQEGDGSTRSRNDARSDRDGAEGQEQYSWSWWGPLSWWWGGY
ncbi:MAG: hypothetical protein Q9162_006597 [Coniocarpon cinnabarinum]